MSTSKAGETLTIQGRCVQTLQVDPAQATTPFSISFETAANRLARLPGMYFEPDGSFVWTGREAGDHWQLEGNLYDHNGRLVYVELKGLGTCPAARWQELLSAFEVSLDEVVVELIESGVFVTCRQLPEVMGLETLGDQRY